MVSKLFDPMVVLAVEVARKGLKSSPRVDPPARLATMLGFRKIPGRAKDAVVAVLDDDAEFRARVLAEADERTIGRAGLAFLERSDGWQAVVDRLVEASDEPVLRPDASVLKLQRRLDAAERDHDRVKAELTESRTQLKRIEVKLLDERSTVASLTTQLESASADAVRLTAERKRAVGELKHTEEVMARHVGERRRLETQLEQMTAAQLNTTTSGGAVTDEQVRGEVDRLKRSLDDLSAQLDVLRSLATPERIAAPTRSPMPLPPGRVDDSIEVAEYLIRVPGMIVLVDGYNVTKEAHDEWSLVEQRDWLYTSLCALAARGGATFDVVFDGANIDVGGTGGRDRGVRVRFSPEGVEADDVVIDSVAAIALDRPVTVVSSDRRVRTGATERGANLLYSHQLISVLAL